MSIVANDALGIVTRCPSSVRMRVERKPTSSTMPSWPDALIRSPRRNGLSMRIITEPNTLAIVSFAASANARPPMPSPAISAPMSALKAFLAMNSDAMITTNTRSVLRISGTS